MPGFDGTGPYGNSTRMGRGRRQCYFKERGAGRRFFTKKEEENLLKEEIEDLESELSAVKERLAETEGQK